MIVLLAGLPGVGKSAIAAGLVAAVGAVVLDKDRIRAALFAPDRVEYSTTQDDFCQTVMLQTAAYLLAQRPHEVVVLDGRTFSRAYQIATVCDFAQQIGTPLRVIECVCSDETARARLERDETAGAHPAANRSFALYREIKARFESIPPPKLTVDTDQALESIIKECVAYLADDSPQRCKNAEF